MGVQALQRHFAGCGFNDAKTGSGQGEIQHFTNFRFVFND
jgi:hypothetical protein